MLPRSTRLHAYFTACGTAWYTVHVLVCGILVLTNPIKSSIKSQFFHSSAAVAAVFLTHVSKPLLQMQVVHQTLNLHHNTAATQRQPVLIPMIQTISRKMLTKRQKVDMP